ncbi:MAG: FtsQ-type POTRA domain-containing protein [Christensenellales bacterium]
MNKRLTIIFISLAVVVLLVVLSCVIFIVGDVQVETTSDLTLTDEQKASIVNDSQIAKYSSIFALSEDKACEYIESKNPTLKVVVIERKAPNKVVINMTGRTGIFAVATEGGYAVLDRDLKRIKNTDEIDGEFLCVASGIDLSDVAVGGFLDNDKLIAMIRAAEEVSFVGARFGAFFTSMQVGTTYVDLTTNKGVIFRLNASDNIGTILKQCYNFYLNATSDAQKSSGYIYLSDSGFRYASNL